MIDAIVSRKLIKSPELKKSGTGKLYAQFLLLVPVQDSEPIVVSGVGFGEVAERISRLCKGNPLSVVGSLKPTEWQDKTTKETRHGLNITAGNALSPYA